MRRTLTLLAPLLVLAACASKPSDDQIPTAAASQPDPPSLGLAKPIHHLDSVAREPMLVEHPNGTLFVSGYGSQVTGVDPKAVPNLWKSSDGGLIWERVDVGKAADGAIGNSDVDLAVGPGGELYFVSMGFNRTTFEGTHVAIGVSHDVGETWNWTLLSEDRLDDRPWVVVTPHGDAHVIWNDGSGVSHATSTDGGRTWEERSKIHPRGGSSHLAVGTHGELAARISPISGSGHVFDEGLELIAISTDGGETWNKHSAPRQLEWDPTLSDPKKVPRWVEPLAWDSEGHLYHLWSEGRTVHLGRSVDHGASWDSWLIAEEGEVAYFPFLAARGPGELAATWFSGRGDDMEVNIALIDAPESPNTEPKTLRAKPFQPDTWREGQEPKVRDPGGEYVPVAFLSGGGLGVVTTVQDSHGDRFGFTWWKVAVPPDF